MQNKTLTKIHNKLLRQEKTIAIAESCTGGLLCSELTRNPGASGYFLLGVVAYSNNSKEKMLQIPAKLISKYGAVSSQVAISMADNIRKIAKADLGIGITGIASPMNAQHFYGAGPKGATTTKPTGTVFIALATGNKILCRSFIFDGSRENIRQHATLEALRLLCVHLSL